jgi:tetratricopeptide (TPR) repeat protein
VGLQALEILKETGDHAAMSGVMNILAMTYYMSQDITGGLEWAAQALSEARLAGDRAREATALSYLGLITGVDGRHDEALQLLDQAADLAEDTGDQRRLMWVYVFKAFEYWAQARFDLMVHTIDAGAELGERIGYLNPGNLGIAVLAHLLAGNLTEARRYADQAKAALVPHDPETPTVLGVNAILTVFSGADRTAAVTALDEAEQSMMGTPRTDYLLFGGAWVAMGWVEIDDAARAERLARYVLGLIDVRLLLEIRSVAQVALGRAAVLQGRLDVAARAFDDATADLGGTDNPHILLEIALGRCYLGLAAGRRGEAQAALQEAERQTEQISSRMEDTVFRARFLASSWIVSRIRTARAAFEAPRGAPARPSEG